MDYGCGCNGWQLAQEAEPGSGDREMDEIGTFDRRSMGTRGSENGGTNLVPFFGPYFGGIIP